MFRVNNLHVYDLYLRKKKAKKIPPMKTNEYEKYLNHSISSIVCYETPHFLNSAPFPSYRSSAKMSHSLYLDKPRVCIILRSDCEGKKSDPSWYIFRLAK